MSRQRKTWSIPPGRLFSYPVPPETDTYKPISHKELDKITRKAIKDSGFKLQSREFSSARDGMVGNARYVIKELSDEEMGLEIGWQNSYDKTLSLKFAIGTRIFICNNGCVSGNFGAFKRRHSGDVQEYTPDMIKESIASAGAIFEDMKEDRNMMKSVILDIHQKAAIIGELFFKDELIGSKQLNIIKEEIKTPTYDYGAPNSLWELYQHTTFSCTDMHPRLWMDTHIKLHRYFQQQAAARVEISIPDDLYDDDDVETFIERMSQEEE